MIRAGHLLAGVLAFGGLAGLAGCKEGVGETCQIDADCDKDLICNLAQRVCALPGTSGDLDAGMVPLPDAPIDAPTDAAADAAPAEAAVAPVADQAAADDEARAQ